MNSNDQYPMSRPDENISGSRTYATSGKIMLSAIIILFFVVILMVFLHLYARWYLLRARRLHFRRRTRNRRATMVFFAADPSTAASAVTSRGLDQAVIKSLPVFTFSESTHQDLTECAVCLSEFEEGESGRVLPGCKHTFHVECIDMWFHSHSTCPLCRCLVEALATVVEEQVVISVSPEPVYAIEPGSSSGSGLNVVSKPAAIEVPRRNLSEFDDDLSRNSFRSPMSRMLSFTRMLSRGNASSPIAGAPPQSPSSNCRIQITESDIERGGEETR